MGCCLSAKHAPTSVQGQDEGHAKPSNINGADVRLNDVIMIDDAVKQGAGEKSVRTTGNSDGTSNKYETSPSQGTRTIKKSATFCARRAAALKGGKLWRAVYDYDASVPETLSFKKYDYVEMIDDSNADWCLVLLLETKMEGYVPRNYIVSADSLEANEWYHGAVGRKEAERLLLGAQCYAGSFLIRDSESQKGSYSLSFHDVDDDGMAVMRHYRVRNMDNGGYYIAPTAHFKTLRELIEHHCEHVEGLSRQLGEPCPRERPLLWDLSPDLKDHWEIDRQTVTFVTKLGQGQFGEVWAGKWKGSTPVAVKTLKPGSMTPEAFLFEAQLMKQFQHPHIVRLYAVCTVGEPILIISELLLDSLLHFLKTGPGRHLALKILIDMAAQIADGMAYLERGNFSETDKDKIVHRDLAARNVLVGENYTVKVADFGLARAVADDHEYIARQETRFPIKWTAPEAAHYSTYTIKSDVWSFGIVLVELVTHGATPYPGMNNTQVLQVLERGFHHPQPHNCPDSLYAIMKSCWHRNPDQRPTFETLKHTLDDYFVSTEPQYQPT